VFKGTSAWVSRADGVQELVFPTAIVTSARVLEGGGFRFQLAPGSYVLVGWSDPSVPPSDPINGYADVSVVAGRTIRQDLPDPHTDCF